MRLTSPALNERESLPSHLYLVTSDPSRSFTTISSTYAGPSPCPVLVTFLDSNTGAGPDWPVEPRVLTVLVLVALTSAAPAAADFEPPGGTYARRPGGALLPPITTPIFGAVLAVFGALATGTATTRGALASEVEEDKEEDVFANEDAPPPPLMGT